MIQLRRIHQRWGAFALEVDLSVPQGEYLVILGPSGCGKSLLLGTIAGLYMPASGEVLLGGEDVTGRAPERREVGFVFQKSSLFPHLDMARNIAFGLKMRGTPRAERRRRVDELVQTLGISDLMERPVTALSGGEAQKVCLARALAVRPSVLLLDEPLSLVDHNARIELQEVLRSLHEELQLTVLHVTHNREEARSLGRRCAVMLGGRIIQEGPLEEVLDQPSCLFVARFLGLESGEVPRNAACSEVCLTGTGTCDQEEQGKGGNT